MSKVYNAVGKVRGSFCGANSYCNSVKIYGCFTKEELIEKLNKLYNSNKLCSVGEFDIQLGAFIEIEEMDILYADGKEYTHSEWELFQIGDIPEDDIDMLIFRLL